MGDYSNKKNNPIQIYSIEKSFDLPDQELLYRREMTRWRESDIKGKR